MAGMGVEFDEGILDSVMSEADQGSRSVADAMPEPGLDMGVEFGEADLYGGGPDWRFRRAHQQAASNVMEDTSPAESARIAAYWKEARRPGSKIEQEHIASIQASQARSRGNWKRMGQLVTERQRIASEAKTKPPLETEKALKKFYDEIQKRGGEYEEFTRQWDRLQKMPEEKRGRWLQSYTKEAPSPDIDRDIASAYWDEQQARREFERYRKPMTDVARQRASVGKGLIEKFNMESGEQASSPEADQARYAYMHEEMSKLGLQPGGAGTLAPVTYREAEEGDPYIPGWSDLRNFGLAVIRGSASMAQSPLNLMTYLGEAIWDQFDQESGVYDDNWFRDRRHELSERTKRVNTFLTPKDLDLMTAIGWLPKDFKISGVVGEQVPQLLTSMVGAGLIGAGAKLGGNLLVMAPIFSMEAAGAYEGWMTEAEAKGEDVSKMSGRAMTAAAVYATVSAVLERVLPVEAMQKTPMLRWRLTRALLTPGANSLEEFSQRLTQSLVGVGFGVEESFDWADVKEASKEAFGAIFGGVIMSGHAAASRRTAHRMADKAYKAKVKELIDDGLGQMQAEAQASGEMSAAVTGDLRSRRMENEISLLETDIAIDMVEKIQEAHGVTQEQAQAIVEELTKQAVAGTEDLAGEYKALIGQLPGQQAEQEAEVQVPPPLEGAPETGAGTEVAEVAEVVPPTTKEQPAKKPVKAKPPAKGVKPPPAAPEAPVRQPRKPESKRAAEVVKKWKAAGGGDVKVSEPGTRSEKHASEIGKAIGVDIQWVEAKAEGVQAGGSVTLDDGSRVLVLTRGAQRDVATLRRNLLHELVHQSGLDALDIEDRKYIEKMSAEYMENQRQAAKKSGDLSIVKRLEADPRALENEATARALEKLADDPAFWRALRAESPTVFQRLADTIRGWLRKLSGVEFKGRARAMEAVVKKLTAMKDAAEEAKTEQPPTQQRPSVKEAAKRAAGLDVPPLIQPAPAKPPTVTEVMTQRKKKLAARNDATYDGPQLDDDGAVLWHQFTDNKTHSTVAVMPGESLSGKLAEMRAKFAAADAKKAKEAALKAKPAKGIAVAAEVEKLYQAARANKLTAQQRATLQDPGLQLEMAQEAKQETGGESARLWLIASQMGWIAKEAYKQASQSDRGKAFADDMIQAGIAHLQQWMTEPVAARKQKGESQKAFDARKGKTGLQLFDPRAGTLAEKIQRQTRTAMRRVMQITKAQAEKAPKRVALPEGAAEEAAEAPRFDIESAPELQAVVREFASMRAAGLRVEDIRKAIETNLGVPISDDAAEMLQKYIDGVKFTTGEQDQAISQSAAEFIKRWKALLAGQATEEGRPELANISERQIVRKLVDVIDGMRQDAGLPPRKSDVDRDRQAREVLADPAKKAGLARRLAAGEMLNDYETIAARTLVDDSAEAMLNSKLGEAELDLFISYVIGHRIGGSKLGQAMRARRDPLGPRKRTLAKAYEILSLMPERFRDEMNGLRKRLEKQALSPVERGEINDRLKAIKGELKEHTKSLAAHLMKKLKLDVTRLTAEQAADRTLMYKMKREIQAFNADMGDKTYEFWMNGLLSLLGTQIVNIVGNSANLFREHAVQRPVEKSINALVRKIVGKPIRGVPIFREKAAVKGMGPAMVNAARKLGLPSPEVFAKPMAGILNEALENAGQAFRYELDVFQEDVTGEDDGGKLDLRGSVHYAIGGTLGRVVRLPGASLQAADTFAKSLIGLAEVQLNAYRLGIHNGLSGDALAEFMVQQIARKGSESWGRAIEEARNLTFQAELGPVGKKVLEIRRMWHKKLKRHAITSLPPLTILDVQYSIPFVSTLANIFKLGVRQSPLGSAKLIWDIGRRVYESKRGLPHLLSGREVTRRVSEQVIALLAWGILGKLVIDRPDEELPWITGSTPYETTAAARRNFGYRTIPPHSIKIWGSVYFTYGRIEPLATALGAMVDSMELIRNARRGMPVGELVGDAMNRMVGAAKGKTFAQGIDLLLSCTDNERGPVYTIRKHLASWMPNIVRGTARSLDPYFRQANIRRADFGEWCGTQVESLLYELFPAPTTGIPPKVDVWGRPVIRETLPGLDIVNPVRMRDTRRIQQWDRYLGRWNRANPSKKETYYPSDLPDHVGYYGDDDKRYRYELSRKEQYLQRVLAGRLALEYLGNTNIDPRSKPTAENIEIIKATLRASRRTAGDMLVGHKLRKGEPLEGISREQ